MTTIQNLILPTVGGIALMLIGTHMQPAPTRASVAQHANYTGEVTAMTTLNRSTWS